jgi:hypothetical protein
MKKKKYSEKDKIIRDIDNAQHDINLEGYDESEAGNKAYNLLDEAKNWLAEAPEPKKRRKMRNVS